MRCPPGANGKQLLSGPLGSGFHSPALELSEALPSIDRAVDCCPGNVILISDERFLLGAASRDLVVLSLEDGLSVGLEGNTYVSSAPKCDTGLIAPRLCDWIASYDAVGSTRCPGQRGAWFKLFLGAAHDCCQRLRLSVFCAAAFPFDTSSFNCRRSPSVSRTTYLLFMSISSICVSWKDRQRMFKC